LIVSLSPASLLLLMQLASPALPVGGFSYSEGLESAVQHGYITDEATAQHWLIDQLHISQSRSDLAVVAKAINAWRNNDLQKLQSLTQWILQTRETSEMRLQTEQMGRSLLEWLRNQTLVDELQLKTCLQLPPTWPLTFALAVASTDLPIQDSLTACAFSWAENMVQASLKAIPLGQRSGQRILATLSLQIPIAVDHAMQLNDDQRQAFSPRLAIVSARHETQYSRLFRS